MNGASGLRRAPDSQFWFGDPTPDDEPAGRLQDTPRRNGHPQAGQAPHDGPGEPWTAGRPPQDSGGYRVPPAQQTGGRIPPVSAPRDSGGPGVPREPRTGDRPPQDSGGYRVPPAQQTGGRIPPVSPPQDLSGRRVPQGGPPTGGHRLPQDSTGNRSQQDSGGHRVGPQPTGGHRIPAGTDRDQGPPSAYFAPVDPDDPPRWPTLADSPSLRVSPVEPDANRPPSQYVPEPEETSVIPRVPPVPPRITEPDDPEDDADLDADLEPERGRGAHRKGDSRVDTEDQPKHGRHRKRKKQPLWRELVTLVAVALLLTFLIQHFVGRVYSIPSGSMEQTLHGCPGCTGDRVFVDKMVYEFRDPLPGDVVVFQGPNSWTGEQVDFDGSGDNPFLGALQYLGSLIGIAPPDERDFVKRVIAIGGQSVECCDEQNRVMVDGRPLDEPYVYWENGGPDERQAFAPVTVPEGTLWVMGDNRANSADSRIQGGGGIRGVVPITKVIGKVRAIVLPPSRWQGVGDHNPQAPPPIAAPVWQDALPAGIGIAAAWPVLWIGRRVRKSLTSRKAE